MNKKIEMVLQVVLACLLLCVGSVILYFAHMLNEKDLLIPAGLLFFMSGIFFGRKLPKRMFVVGILVLLVVSIVSYLWASGERHLSRIEAYTGEDQTVKVNEAIEFNASRSIVGRVGVVGTVFVDRSLFLWDFDDRDGIQIDATGLRVNHTYTTTGTYKVTLILVVLPGYPFEDIYGMDTDSLTVTVTPD